MNIAVISARIVAVLAIIVLALPFAWEKISNDYFMTVTGISMKPTYQVGDVLVVQERTGKELERIGQPVVVAFTPGDKTTQYVHRIVANDDDGATLKGDNNSTADPNKITAAQVMGTPRTVLTGMSAKAYHLSQFWVTRGVVAVLVIVALFLPVRSRTAGTVTASTAEPTTSGS